MAVTYVRVRCTCKTSLLVITTGISSQEADTLMVRHCKEVAKSDAQANVNIYIQDRGILLLTIGQVPELAQMQHISREQE